MKAVRCHLRPIGHIGLTVALLMSLALPALGAESTPMSAAGVQAGSSADLEIANRRIATFRAEVYGATPAERVTAVEQRIASIVEQGGQLIVSTRAIQEGAAVLVNDHLVFRVLAGDVDPDSTDTPAEAASAAASRLDVALQEIAESRNASALLPAVGMTLLATVALVVLLWALARLRRWVIARTQQALSRATDRIAGGWAGHVFGRAGLISLITVPIRVLIWAVAFLVVYTYAGFVLARFPYTRPWGEALRGNLLSALGHFGTSLLEALPGLLFVALIFVIARIVVRAIHAFFAGVQSKRVNVGWVDETTARPTGRLATVVIWLFALVAAYPYIPGSGSEAFKGVGVFVGLMLSLGASGIVNQAVSGLMLMYTRSLKTGEFVRIGEIEGTVSSVGFLTTRLETLRHEEITIPNSVIATSVTRNFSRLAASGNLRVATQVTIGYDTPWRQVHAMLLEAAGSTSGIADSPPSRVLQTNLHDFYVEYTLLVSIEEPRFRAVILSDLHGHIQDVFNEHGVQIMSPNYEADADQVKVVRREDWYKTPATRETGAPARPGAAGDATA